MKCPRDTPKTGTQRIRPGETRRSQARRAASGARHPSKRASQATAPSETLPRGEAASTRWLRNQQTTTSSATCASASRSASAWARAPTGWCGRPSREDREVRWRSRSASTRSGTARSRRPAVLRRLHAIDARRLQERRSWVVSFFILSAFRRDRDAIRRTQAPTRKGLLGRSCTSNN